MEIPTALTSTLARYLTSLQARNMCEHTITAFSPDMTQLFS